MNGKNQWKKKEKSVFRRSFECANISLKITFPNTLQGIFQNPFSNERLINGPLF